MSYKAEQTMNGTWGECYINDTLVAECTAFKAEVAIEEADIPMCGTMAKGKKPVGFEGTGEMKLNKVTNRMAILMSDNIKAGKSTIVTIMSKLADPDSLGAERILIKDAKINKLTLVDWEAKKNGEETVPFSFTDWQWLDQIQPK